MDADWAKKTSKGAANAICACGNPLRLPANAPKKNNIRRRIKRLGAICELVCCPATSTFPRINHNPDVHPNAQRTLRRMRISSLDWVASTNSCPCTLHQAGTSCKVPGSVASTSKRAPGANLATLSWVRMTGRGHSRPRASRTSAGVGLSGKMAPPRRTAVTPRKHGRSRRRSQRCCGRGRNAMQT